MVKEKKNNKRPVMIAPGMLAAAKVMPRRITEVRTVPKIPAISWPKKRQQNLPPEGHAEEPRSIIPSVPTAIPNSTHKKAGVTVIRAAKLRKAAMTPMIALAIRARPVQPSLQLQL